MLNNNINFAIIKINYMENKKVQHIQVPHNLGGMKEVKLNPTDYLIYGYMRKYMDGKTYKTFVSLRTLAEKSGVSINTVSSSVKKLQDAGEIKILEKKQGRNNVYEILKTGRYFERFTYEFMDSDLTTKEEKGVLLAMQQYTNKEDTPNYAVTTYTNEELAQKMNINVRALARVFRSLEDKGILITSRTNAFDKISGLRKTAKLIDLSLVCQAILFVNKRVDEHEDRIQSLENEIKRLRKELLNNNKPQKEYAL